MTSRPVELRELCTLITKGTTPTSVGFDFSNDGVPFLRAQNISGGIINFTEGTLFITKDVHNALARSRILPGDVLISIAGTIGRVGVVPEGAPELNCNQAVALLRTKDSVLRPFLRHWLEGADAQRQMRGATVTGTIQNLSLSQIGELTIQLPSLSEQHRIAAILDQADALRAKRRQALALLDGLVPSIFDDTFGEALRSSERHPLSTLIQEFRYGTSTKSGNHGYPTLRIPNVASGSLNLNELKTVAVDPAEFSRLRLRDGDLLFVRTNGNQEYVGRCAVFDESAVAETGFETSSFIYASYLIRARLDPDRVLPVALQGYLSSGEGRRGLLSHSKTSAGQFNINTEGLGALRVPNLPMKLQREFVQRVAAVERQRKRQMLQLAEMDALFSSLQYRAFTEGLSTVHHQDERMNIHENAPA